MVKCLLIWHLGETEKIETIEKTNFLFWKKEKRIIKIITKITTKAEEYESERSVLSNARVLEDFINDKQLEFQSKNPDLDYVILQQVIIFE